MPRNDVILWLDLETTGSSDKAAIIEVGAVLSDTKPELNAISGFKTVVKPPIYHSSWVAANYEDDTVLAMHTSNGLDKELRDPLIPDLKEAEKMLLRWLNQTVGTSTEHIPLAGSGVSHFDRKFIRRDWPMLDKRLTYWAYDVGVLRRTFRLLGLTEFPGETKAHRAFDDALLHLEEMRYYLAQLGTLAKLRDAAAARETEDEAEPELTTVS